MLDSLLQYLPTWVFWGTVISIITLLATVVAVPWVISHLPVDYFSEPRRHPLREEMGLLAWLLAGLKNALGGLMVLAGIVMLFTPGQGLLVTLAGLLIMNFPGKYRLERALVAREGVLRALNWLRRRRSLPPFDPPRKIGG